jgi:recombinational DNA repair protein (RecF pathway)
VAYHIHNTDAYVLRSIPVGEANTMVFLFTKNLGLIVAIAQGSRLLKSKLRYSLQPFMKTRVSLVKGRSQWRVVNAVSKEQLISGLENINLKEVIARLFNFVQKFVGEEEKHLEVFNNLEKGINFLAQISEESVRDVEAVIVFRILYSLGYIAPSDELVSLLDSHIWEIGLIENLEKQKNGIISSINNAFKESQLD